MPEPQARWTRRLGALVVGLALAAPGGHSPAQATILTFRDHASFVVQTGGTSATGALPDLGRIEGNTSTVGSITFSLAPPSSRLHIGAKDNPNVSSGDFTALMPGPDIAISGIENLNLEVANPVYALGLYIVEPAGHDCDAPCFDTTFTVVLKDGTTTVGVVPLNVPNDVLAFFGVWSDQPFTRVEIRDTTATIDNEYFGEVFTSTTSPLTRGDTACAYGDAGCSVCVAGLLAQIRDSMTGESRLDIQRTDLTFQFPDPLPGEIFGLRNHVQGVARLPDAGGQGRMIITDNGQGSPGFHLAFQDIRGATEALYSTETRLRDRVSLDIRNNPAYGNHDHPGGVQAQGDIVAVAMEKGATGHAAVYFLKVTGETPAHLSTFHLDGSQGEPHQAENNAATVGFVRLASGYYLLGVSGKDHGQQGIWFYVSSTTEITAETTWRYIDFYEPPCVGYGSESDDCYVGAGGGLNFVTDCSGTIYLLAMHGTDRRRGIGERDEFEYLQIFRVLHSIEARFILDKVAQQQDNLGARTIDDESFRWAGGVYVSSKGRIAVMNTERRTNNGDNDYVDGDVYLGKPVRP